MEEYSLYVSPGAQGKDLAVVLTTTGYQYGMSYEYREILDATWEEHGIKAEDVAIYVLAFPDTVSTRTTRKVLEDEMHPHKLVLTLGASSMHALCNTRRPLADYAGSMTWNDTLGTWILPSLSPQTVLDEKWDDFADLWDHMRQAAALIKGELPFPDRDFKLDWEMVGHNGYPGYKDDDKVWTGYFECDIDEETRAQQIVAAWLNRLHAGEQILFGADTESFNLRYDRPMTMLQLCDDRKAFAFNFGVVRQTLPMFQELFAHPNASFTLHNLPHDYSVIAHWLGVKLGDERITDTLCWALGLSEKGTKSGLKFLSRRYLGAPHYEEALDQYLDKNNVNYGHIPPDVLAEYGCLDVYYGRQLALLLPTLVEIEGTTKSVVESMLPAQRALADIRYQGVKVDVDRAQRTSEAWGPRIDEAVRAMQKYAADHGFPYDPSVTASQDKRVVCDCVPASELYRLNGAKVASYRKILREAEIGLGDCSACNGKRYHLQHDHTLNLDSPKQLQHLCFDILHMEESFKGRSCAKEFWEVNEEHEFAKLMRTYKDLYYLRRNLLDKVHTFVLDDGNLHPNFFLAGTKTGRLASREPNMQNIPSHGPRAKEAKGIFMVDAPRTVIANFDYTALEMVVNAALTEDETLLSHLYSDAGIYRMVAGNILGKPADEVTADERQVFKTVVLASGYGVGGKKLVKIPAIAEYCKGDPDAAQELIDSFWDTYPKWKAMRDSWREEALTKCELSTELGRKRRWEIITPANEFRVLNQSINFKGQSVGSDITLRALTRVHETLTRKKWGRVLLTVHDSLVVQLNVDTLHRAMSMVARTMCDVPLETDVPFYVDASVGLTYGEQEPYDNTKNYKEWFR